MANLASRPTSYFMKGSRIGFCRWSREDFPLAWSLWGNPKATQFIGGPFSEQQVRSRLRIELENQEHYGVQYWPIFLLQRDEYFGCAGLRPYDTPANMFELGVHLLPEYWHRGFAEEAARIVIKFAFSEIHATALFAGHHPENGASRRLLTKLGFKFTCDELYPPTGRLHPSYILDASWAKRDELQAGRSIS